MTTHRRQTAVAVAVFGSLLLATACGGSDDDGVGVASLDDAAPGTTGASSADDEATTPADREEAMLAYVECIREQGIDMPDPVMEAGPDGGGGVIAIEGELGDDDFEAAQEECGPIMDEAMGEIEIDPEQEAEMRAELLEFAQCMRDHGIDMPDPVFDDDGRVTMEAAPGGRLDPTAEDEMAAASEECGREGPGMIVNGGPAGDVSEGG